MAGDKRIVKLKRRRAQGVSGSIRSKMTISPDVIYKRLAPDDGILLNIRTKRYYSLNESACFIFDSLKRGIDDKTIVRNLTTKLGAPRKRAAGDFQAVVELLIKEKIME